MGVDAKIFFTTSDPLTAAEVIDVAARLTHRVGAHCAWFGLEAEEGRAWEHALHPVEDEEREEFRAVTGCRDRTVLEFRTTHRYYGVDYERGPLLMFLNVIDVMATLGPFKAWYGSDSHPEKVPFNTGATAREELWAHFIKEGHWRYRTSFAGIFGNVPPPTCPRCKVPTLINRRGKQGALYADCTCCDLRLESSDRGTNWGLVAPRDRWLGTETPAAHLSMLIKRWGREQFDVALDAALSGKDEG